MTIYTSVKDVPSSSLIIAATRLERTRYANLFITETKAKHSPRAKYWWGKAQLLHIIGIPYFLSVAIIYTLLVLDLRIPFPGYQFFLPTAGFMLHLGIFNHDRSFTIIGLVHMLFSVLVNVVDCFLYEKRDCIIGIPPFVDLSWEFLSKLPEIWSNSNKYSLVIMTLRYIVICYMLWYLQRVHILCAEENEFNDKIDDYLERGEDGEGLSEEEREMFIRRLSSNEKKSCIASLLRILFPQHPIIHSVTYFKTVFCACGLIVTLSILLCPK